MSNTLRIGNSEIEHRLKIKDVRRAKEQHGVDFGDFSENSPLIQMNTDPLVLAKAIWALYEQRLVSKGIKSLEQLEDAIEADQMDNLRQSLIDSISGFFPLARTVYTSMQEVLTGSIDLKTAVQAAAEQAKVSGTNS